MLRPGAYIAAPDGDPVAVLLFRQQYLQMEMDALAAFCRFERRAFFADVG
jgi:hypothetical protein